METKPLEMLRELLLHAGNVVSKDELLDAIWPDVTVVEASLPTAVRKLRLALGNDRVIETVSGIGYRLAVPVEVEELAAAPDASVTVLRPAAIAPIKEAEGSPDAPHSRAGMRMPALFPLSAVFAIALTLLAFMLSPPGTSSATKVPPAVTQQDAASALRTLDVAAIERMIAAGWEPAAPWDKEGNDALSMLLNHCEWDPAHDRRQMLLMARTLIEGGAPIDRRNVWGDTAYSIAKAPRYCGPDHPITQMLEAMCYGGSMGPKDKCLATYELTADQRRAQGLPPKS